MASLAKVDSVVILESGRHRDDRDLHDHHTFMATASESGSSRAVPRDDQEPLLVLDVALQRGLLLALTTAVVGFILLLATWSRQGIEVSRFEAASKTDAQRVKLLDQYNSYSGTATALLGRPLEISVALLVQVVVVRCAAASMLNPETSTATWIATLALSGTVSYLVNNALNALNVQLRPLDVHAVISATDLTTNTSADTTAASVTYLDSNLVHTVSEATPGNAITNTVLRNLVLPRQAKAPLTCQWKVTSSMVPPDDLIEYGFPQHDWYARLLSQAPTSERLRVVANATNRSANAGVRSANLPMDAARAAELFMSALLLVPSYLPVDVTAPYFDGGAANVTVPVTGTFGLATTRAGLLPRDSSASETAQREWFLSRSQVLLAQMFEGSSTARGSDIGLEFTHTPISPSIAFDAVTFEVEMNRSLFANTGGSANASRVLSVVQEHCGPWPALCLYAKTKYSTDSDAYDPPMHVQAFAMCLNANGTESLNVSVAYARGGSQPPTSIVADCAHTSQTSLLVVSVAKRLTADSLALHSEFDVSAANVRKYVTFTVGRLAWQLRDLSSVFQAQCGAPNACAGLHVDLSNTTTRSVARQHLLVSADALPLSYLSVPNYQYTYPETWSMQRPATLVRVHEPPPPRVPNAWYDVAAGDILLPHNVRDLEWGVTALWTGCRAEIEDRLQLVLKNHMYMEYGLQPAYTAAAFFLLQNGVVKEAIALSNGKTTLNFDGNQQQIAVRISVPSLNASLTIAGCVLLSLAVLAVVAWPTVLQHRRGRDPLRGVSAPHAIARVLLDETRFPPLLLKRRVVEENSSGCGGDLHDRAANFHIESLQLISAWSYA